MNKKLLEQIEKVGFPARVRKGYGHISRASLVWGEPDSKWTVDYVLFGTTSSGNPKFALAGVISPEGHYFSASEIFNCRKVTFINETEGHLLAIDDWPIGEVCPAPEDTTGPYIVSVSCPVSTDKIKQYEETLSDATDQDS